ncbi:hypothetical protein AAGS40_17320 [Paraburkholderia sp. PREW-6R]|uniref:hypothetical protein n=1 Tax=Paraburkholderia sp. PREW-6R TaxID=3141544 RepID=UPI0031F4DD44
MVTPPTLNAFSFGCSACGKCCNTPPALSLPELFRHRDLFIGCLAIGRVPRRRTGERLRTGNHTSVLDESDVAAFDSIARTLLHHANGETFSIVAQGYDYPSLARCPALLDDGLCAVHLQGKPVTCEVVPLDPLVPDRFQHLVLAGRSQSAAYLGADCIQEGAHADEPLLVANGRIEDDGATNALSRRRAALELDHAFWGRAVFASLRRGLFDSAAALARIPPGGFLTISIVPALLAVAGASAPCRDWCIDFIDSQLALIDRSIAQAMTRRRLDDRHVTQELRGFANAYQRAKAVLSIPLTRNKESGDSAFATTVEAYLRGASLSS